MGESGFSLFEFHFGRSEAAESERDAEDAREARRRSAIAERERRAARRSDGGGSKVKTGLTVLGALSVVGSLAGAAWYLLKKRGGDGDDGSGRADRSGRAGGRGTAGARRRVTVLGGSGNRPVRSDAGTSSLVGLAFLLASTALVRRYVDRPLAAKVGDRLEDADEVTVVTSEEA